MKNQIALSLALSLVVPFAAARLPAPTEEVKQKAAETAERSAWSDKVGAYKLCLHRRNMVVIQHIIAELLLRHRHFNTVSWAVPSLSYFVIHSWM